MSNVDAIEKRREGQQTDSPGSTGHWNDFGLTLISLAKDHMETDDVKNQFLAGTQKVIIGDLYTKGDC